MSRVARRSHPPADERARFSGGGGDMARGIIGAAYPVDEMEKATFFHNPEQEAAARRSAAAAQQYFDRPIVTEIVPAPKFWPAEDYPQRYFAKHPGHGSCHWIRGWVPAEGAASQTA